MEVPEKADLAPRFIEAEGFAIISCSWRAVFEHGYAQGSEKILILPMKKVEQLQLFAADKLPDQLTHQVGFKGLVTYS